MGEDLYLNCACKGAPNSVLDKENNRRICLKSPFLEYVNCGFCNPNRKVIPDHNIKIGDITLEKNVVYNLCNLTKDALIEIK